MVSRSIRDSESYSTDNESGMGHFENSSLYTGVGLNLQTSQRKQFLSSSFLYLRILSTQIPSIPIQTTLLNDDVEFDNWLSRFEVMLGQEFLLIESLFLTTSVSFTRTLGHQSESFLRFQSQPFLAVEYG